MGEEQAPGDDTDSTAVSWVGHQDLVCEEAHDELRDDANQQKVKPEGSKLNCELDVGLWHVGLGTLLFYLLIDPHFLLELLLSLKQIHKVRSQMLCLTFTMKGVFSTDSTFIVPPLKAF